MSALTTPQAVKDAAVKIARESVEKRCCGRGVDVCQQINERTGECIGWAQECCGNFDLIPMYPDQIASAIEALPIAPDDRDEKIAMAVEAINVALGHLTGGMDGDWRDCNLVELLRSTHSALTEGK